MSKVPTCDGPTGEPMTARQHATILRLATELGANLTADWEDMDKKLATVMIWSLRNQRDGVTRGAHHRESFHPVLVDFESRVTPSWRQTLGLP